MEIVEEEIMEAEATIPSQCVKFVGSWGTQLLIVAIGMMKILWSTLHNKLKGSKRAFPL